MPNGAEIIRKSWTTQSLKRLQDHSRRGTPIRAMSQELERTSGALRRPASRPSSFDTWEAATDFSYAETALALGRRRLVEGGLCGARTVDPRTIKSASILVVIGIGFPSIALIR
jgi:hypothetical protein